MFKYLIKSGIKGINIPSNKLCVKFFAVKKEINKLSFVDKIKQKFSIKPEEKINYAELKNRNEEQDNLKASKLENEEDLIDETEESEGITKHEDLRSSALNIKLDIDHINTENVFKHKSDSGIEELKGTSLQILKSKYKVNVDNFCPHVKSIYEETKYSETLSPRFEELVKLGFTDFNIRILVQKSHIFILNPSNVEKLKSCKELLKTLLTDFTDEEINGTLSCIPNIVELKHSKIEANIKNTINFLKDINHKSLLIEYPLLISNFTSDINKLEFYFKLYLEMTKEDLANLSKRFPLLLTATPDNVLNIFKTVDRVKFDRQEWRQIIEKNPKVFLFRHTQLTNVVALLTQHGMRATEVLTFLKDYPDLLLANRYSLLKNKLFLLEQLKMNKDTIKNLIRTYPFILLKSYNSFINKVFYFNTELKMDIEETDIYPLIYTFNLNTDIKPRCELMKKANKWIPFSEAFSMSVEELAVKLGLDNKEIIKPEVSGLHERDLLFRYSKYLTI